MAKGGDFELVELDLASLNSARAAADKLLEKGEFFDVVIANAGVMATPFGHTSDGFETQFGTNHLGHFVFVNRIAPLIRSGGRLINLASSGHRFSNVDLDDPNFKQHPTSLSLPTDARRPQTFFSLLLSTSGTAGVACALRPCIPEAYKPNWVAIWIRVRFKD